MTTDHPEHGLNAAHSSRLPLHIQISETLAREIQAGLLVDGEKLAPERKLAKTLGIAVGTLRKALADLESKGFITRVQGSGNYVTLNERPSTIYGFFRLELLRGGGLPSAEVLSVKRLRIPKRLQFGRSEHGFRIRRLRRINQVDAALEEIWLDGAYATTLNKPDLSESLYQFYREQLGFWITRAEDKLSVERVPTWKPDTFAAQAPEFWGTVHRRSWDQQGHLAEYSQTWFDPNTIRYVSRLQ